MGAVVVAIAHILMYNEFATFYDTCTVIIIVIPCMKVKNNFNFGKVCQDGIAIIFSMSYCMLHNIMWTNLM